MSFTSKSLAEALGSTRRAERLAGSPIGERIARRIDALIAEEVAKHVKRRTDVEDVTRRRPKK